MSFRQVDVNNSLSWLSKGWELFTKNPGVWILMALITFVIMLMMLFIPLLGQLAATVLGTLLFAGMVYAAHEQDVGRTMEINHLFHAFQDSSKLSPLVMLSLIALTGALLNLMLDFILLGAISAAVMSGSIHAGTVALGVLSGGLLMWLSIGLAIALLNLVLGLILFGGAIGAISAAAMGGSMHTSTVALGAIGGGLLVRLSIGLAIKLTVSALLFFSIPKVILEGGDPITAAKDSLNAVLANIGPILVFGLIALVLSLCATLMLGLGWLVLMPVLAGAIYAAYRNVFGNEISLPKTLPPEPPTV